MTELINITYKGQSIPILVNDSRIKDEMGGGFYEQGLLEVIEKYFHGGLFIDIGANVGNHSIFFAEFCKADLVIAIEPHPETFKLLEQNTVKYFNIYKLNTCLSDKEKNIHLKVNGRQIASAHVAPDGELEFRTTTVDNITENLSSPIMLVKIDVEHHEKEVLTGAIKTIERNHPDLFIESFDNLEWVKNFLLPFGYELKQRYCNAPVYHFSIRKDIPVTYIKP